MVSTRKYVEMSLESSRNKKKRVAGPPRENTTTAGGAKGKKRKSALLQKEANLLESRSLPASPDAGVLVQRDLPPQNEGNEQTGALLPTPMVEAGEVANQEKEKTSGNTDLENTSALFENNSNNQTPVLQSSVSPQEQEKDRLEERQKESANEPQKTTENVETAGLETNKPDASTEKAKERETEQVVATNASVLQGSNSSSVGLVQAESTLSFSEKQLKGSPTPALDKLREFLREEDELVEEVLPREVYETEKGKLSKRPEYPPGMDILIKKEVAFLQRKVRAYRKVKNRLLTISLKELEREAEVKNWGSVPDCIKTGQCHPANTLLETFMALWPAPFASVEEQWWSRHLAEFAKEWNIPQSEAMTSKKLTPYMKYVRAFPPPELLAVKPDLAPIPPSTVPKFPFPMTNTNYLLDAKSMLYYYGVHKSQDWEVKDNVDYEVLDFWDLLEDAHKCGQALVERLMYYREALKVSVEQS